MGDEFALFLVIGLAVLAVLLVATNSFFITPQEPVVFPVPNVSEGDVRLVGLHGEEARRVETVNFAVGTEMLGQQVEGKRLFSGLLFGDSEFTFETTEDTDALTLTFSVVQTNDLGRLFIKLNNELIEGRRFPTGEYTFTVNGPVPAGSRIVIVPESSSWQIWAPTLYVLTNIRVSTTSYAQQANEFRFTLTEEYDFFTNARLEIRRADSYGRVAVRLNGNQMYYDFLGATTVLEFGRDKLVRGENVLRIEAEAESAAAGSADLVVFFTSHVDKELVLPFRVSLEEYNRMKGGFIRFEITDVSAPGGVSIKTRIGSDVLLNEFTTAAPGPVTVFFGKDDVRPGQNEVIIHGIDGATFKVRNLYVELR